MQVTILVAGSLQVANIVLAQWVLVIEGRLGWDQAGHQACTMNAVGGLVQTLYMPSVCWALGTEGCLGWVTATRQRLTWQVFAGYGGLSWLGHCTSPSQ